MDPVSDLPAAAGRSFPSERAQEDPDISGRWKIARLFLRTLAVGSGPYLAQSGQALPVAVKNDAVTAKRFNLRYRVKTFFRFERNLDNIKSMLV